MNNNIILLHGALGSASQFDILKTLLPDNLEVYTPEFHGHGNTPLISDFTIEKLTEQILNYINEKGIERTGIFGHSMGGYVGLYLASKYPERISKVYTLGTMLKWDEEILQRELGMMNAEKIEEKIPAFAKHLEKTHIYGWKDLLKATKGMMTDLVQQQYINKELFDSLETPIRLGIGDRDTTAGLAETIYYYFLLKNGQLEVFPNTPHAFERVDMGKLGNSISNYFNI